MLHLHASSLLLIIRNVRISGSLTINKHNRLIKRTFLLIKILLVLGFHNLYALIPEP
jgi:hypothetical protein